MTSFLTCTLQMLPTTPIQQNMVQVQTKVLENAICFCSVQTVRAAGGGEASESDPEQTGSFREEQTEGQGVPQGKALK